MRTLLSLSKSYLGWCGVLLPLLLGHALTTPDVARAQPATQQPDPAARQAFEEGRTFYDHGRFADALRKFQESYALSNNPKLLFNIGRAADSEGEQAQAYDAYTAYLQRVPDADNREFVEARLAKLKAAGAATPANAAPGKQGSTPHSAQPAPSAPPAQLDAPIDPYPPAYVSPGAPGSAPVAYPQPTPSQPVPANFPGRFRLYGGLRLGVGGTMHVEDDTKSALDVDLKPSYGLQLGAELVPVRFFGIGFETRFIWFNEKNGLTRDLLIDFAVKPSFRFALRRIPLEFYGALPIGVTIPSADDPNSADTFDVDFHVGGNVGLVAGMNYFVSPHMGLNFELGGLIHWYGANAVDAAGDKAGSFTYTLTQFTLLTLNAVYAL
jgi:hypothetical protein